MKKLPLELFGPKVETKPRSPLIWNGLEFDLCEELTLTEISQLLTDCRQLNFEVITSNFDFSSKLYTSTSLLSDLKSWYKNTDFVFTELNDLAGKFLLRLKQQEDEVGLIEGLVSNLDIKLYDIQSVMSSVTDGNLIQGSAKYRVTYSSGKYVIKRELQSGPFFTCNDVISITDRAEGKLIDYYPYKDIRIIAGSGIYINESEYYKTLNIANIIRSSGSIEVTQLLNKFLVKPRNLLLTSKNIDIQTTILPETGFKISMKPDASYALDFSFSAGYGISISGYTVSIASNLYPVIMAGNGIAVTKDSYNNYIAHFNYLTSGVPFPIKVTALYPLAVTYSSVPADSPTGFDQELYTVAIRNDYQQNMQKLFDGIVKGLENVNNELQHLTMDNLSEGAKRKLACPLLNLFDLAALGKLNQDTGDDTDPITQKLVTKFGTAPVNLDLTIEVLPMAANRAGGPGAGIGLSFEFNVFWYLEAYIQGQLGDSSFTISPSDINSRYYVSVLDSAASNLVVKDANSGEVGSVDYNTAWVVNQAIISDTYPGMAISFTTGDFDFFQGNVRNSQTNGVPVVLPSTFFSDVEADIFKVSVTNVSKVENAANGYITYTMTIYDGYLNKTFTTQWARPSVITNGNADYMIEVSSGSVAPPDYIRLIARLYANWKYQNSDLCKCLRLIGLTAKSVTETNNDFLYSRITNTGYLSAEPYASTTNFKLTVSKFDKSTGDCKVSVDTVNATIGYAYYSVDSFLKEISIPVKFRILPLTSAKGSNSSIASACCWTDLQYSSDISCVTVAPPEATTTAAPMAGMIDCAKVLFNADFHPTSAPTTTMTPTTTVAPTTTRPASITTVKPAATTTKAPTTTSS